MMEPSRNFHVSRHWRGYLVYRWGDARNKDQNGPSSGTEVHIRGVSLMLLSVIKRIKSQPPKSSFSADLSLISTMGIEKVQKRLLSVVKLRLVEDITLEGKETS